MRLKRTTPTPHRALTGRIRLTAVAAALLAATAVTLSEATAASAPAPARADAARLVQAGAAAESAGIAGTAWAVDPASGRLVVTADSRVTGARLAKLRNATASFGDVVRITRVAGRFSRLLSGGDAIYGGGYRCSLGFNVRSGSTYYFLTAGHCGQAVSTWYANSSQSTLIGSTVAYTFPRNDYALVKYSGAVSPPGTVGSQDIATAANAYVGESVKRRGSTTGIHGGTVTGLNATVNYGNGEIVRGLIQTNVCAEPGDSGGPLYDGTKALGLTSGGSGNCSSGGTTFFQPVTAALSKYGVSVY